MTGSAAVITSTAKIHADQPADAFLFAYAEAHQALVREIYRRHVVGDEHDWARLEAEIREQGWTRREVRSAKSLADAAQEAAVESAKLDLENTAHALAKAETRLARSKKAHDGTECGRARRVQRLQAKKTRWSTISKQAKSASASPAGSSFVLSTTSKRTALRPTANGQRHGGAGGLHRST